MIGVIAAMQVEVEALVALMCEVEKVEISGLSFFKGRISNQQVVLVQSGIGKIKATFSTFSLIHHFKPEYILNIGSCGGFKPEVNLEDVVIAKKIAFYDVDVPGWDKSFDNPKLATSCNENMIEHAVKIIKSKVHIGDMVCGDSFIYKDEQVKKIINDFKDVIACDMESGAIAYTAKTLNVPCLVIRGVSDNVLRKDNHITFDEYVLKASKSSANFCKEYILSYNGK